MSKKENVSRFVLPKGAEFRGIEENDGVVSVLYETIANLWTQDKTNVSNGKLPFKVGSPIQGYEACGISDWYFLGANDGRLLITTKYCPGEVTLPMLFILT